MGCVFVSLPALLKWDFFSRAWRKADVEDVEEALEVRGDFPLNRGWAQDGTGT